MDAALRGRRPLPSLLLPSVLIVVAVSVVLSAQIPSPSLAFLSALNLIASGIGIVASTVSGLRPVSLVYFCFSFAWLGVAPVFQVATGLIAWRDTNALGDEGRVATALAMNLLALIGFTLGSLVARARERAKTAKLDAPLALPNARVRRSALPLASWGMLILTPVAIQANGGFSSLFSSRLDLAQTRSSLGTGFSDLGGPVYALTRILPGALAICVTILAIVEIRRNWRGVGHIRGGHFVSLLIGVGGLVLFANPWTNSRFTAAAAFGAVLLVLLRPTSRVAATFVASLLLFATLLIYPLANSFRYGDETQYRTGFSAFLGPDFDGFQQVINTLTYVESQGFTYGNHVLSGIFFFIPRSVWPGKAEPASFAIAENAGYAFTNLSLPVHAEFYLELGWIGVALGMGLLGFAAATLDAGWLANPASVSGIVAAYASVAMLGIIRGPIGAQVPVWGAVVLILLISLRRDTAEPPTRDGASRRTRAHSRSRGA